MGHVEQKIDAAIRPHDLVGRKQNQVVDERLVYLIQMVVKAGTGDSINAQEEITQEYNKLYIN